MDKNQQRELWRQHRCFGVLSVENANAWILVFVCGDGNHLGMFAEKSGVCVNIVFRVH